jgi:hypothetical protein
MSVEDIYYSIKNKKSQKNSKEIKNLNSLYETPKKEKGVDMPHLQIFEPNYLHQADLLYMPTDDLEAEKNADSDFYTTVTRDKVTGSDKLFFDYIHKVFTDTDEKKDYVIYGIVKPTKKNAKAKSGLYYQYFDKKEYATPPTDENLYEYTKCDILVNAKWAKFKKAKVVVKPVEVTTSKYSYILVVVDAHTKKVDAEPLKSRSAEAIVSGFKSIYSRDYLDIPDVVSFDAGSEFKNEEVQSYFKSLHTRVKYALPNRHRQQALVERQNKTIGTVLLKRQANEELISGKQNKKWVKDLPLLVKVMDENVPKNPLITAISDSPLSTKYSQDLIPLHARVRSKLDYPIDAVTHKRIGSIFRSGDIKFSPQVKEVKDIVLKPGYPPLYLVGNDKAGYTKQQLQVFK